MTPAIGLRAAGGEFQVVSPWSGEVVGSAPRMGPDAVARGVAVARARERLTPDQRAEVLHAAARELGRRRDEFAERITREAGICVADSAKEVERAHGNLVTAAEEAKRLHGEALQLPNGRRLAITVREPVGVVAAITPYNRPLNQVVVKLAPAIAAGNGVVLKPSEKTPLSALAFADLLGACGLPTGTVTVVTGDPGVVGPALAGGAVDMVTFTGSAETGHAVARAAAGKKVTLELGGNDPLIVLDDGDLEAAARLTTAQAFATAGQSCRGVKRVIALDGIADELVERVAALATRKRCGDPFDPATDVGPLIDVAAAERVEHRCASAVEDGAVLVHGGGREGALYAPTVLDRVPAGSELVAFETFGPVAPVIRVRDDDEAVDVANSTDYGLQAGVVTASFERFMSIAHRLEVGAVNLMEGPAFDSPHIPFGGVKRSGVGREGIRWAIEEMTTLKTITMPRP
jgi:acyl-CoA reductase-like NAD-dependent aldehyde dehydrogenase